MKFKRRGEVTAVLSDEGFFMGSIRKWNGLHEAKDWRGEGLWIHGTRKEAAAAIEQIFNFHHNLASGEVA